MTYKIKEEINNDTIKAVIDDLNKIIEDLNDPKKIKIEEIQTRLIEDRDDIKRTFKELTEDNWSY